ncbi:MAG TPA: DUF2254 domain-containing protein [Gaiellaceae bacterium]|nr:DUF2254 domain-containing protein [Gaiellaceae bacterium]
MRRERLLHAIRTGLWFTPLACVLAGVVLAIGTTLIDRAWGPLVPQSITGSPRDAQQALSTIASAIVTLMGLVLTMTLVVVQLAMGQFSSRIVRPLLENHPSQLVIGIFGATLVQSLAALRGVDVVAGKVPGVSTLTAYALLFSSLVLLVVYSHKIGVTLRSSSLIDTAGDRARALVDDLYPPHEGPADDDPSVIRAPRPGNVIKVMRDRLVEAARDADCRIELLPMIGDFVPMTAPLLRVHGDGSRLDRETIARFVLLGDERAMKDDLGAAMRALVDIAERGLQQPFTDPTTAVQAIHRLHDVLRQLADRDIPDGSFRDDAGVVRFVEPRRDWDAYVRLAFDEIRIAGAASPQIPRRLRAALLDLKTVARPERQAALDRQIELLDRAVTEALDEPDARAARVADVQGIGSGDDMLVPPRNGRRLQAQ